ncbi:hypothetical protein PV10_07760 [Exophiala mesophila]|uniref:F-box domain-containing protein n=1 Tax=Exophiala mesophila TaxID=212818 RepID=A0A0D1ZUJ5_EXOME|nr:uncharacterized protein PV10_07760 [Exophiala mesophila]KIV90453.1 hypothetical protein PV10_07760 [Exophiala mesophila]
MMLSNSRSPDDPKLYGTVGTTASQMTNTTPSLPNEVLQLIVQNLEKVDLKNARLACKTLASMAEPILFRELVLVPYQDCLEEFIHFDKSGVTRHTITLIYDTRWRFVSRTLRKPHVRLDSDILLEDLAFVGFRNRGDQALEILFLVSCLQVLPALRSIRILESDVSTWPRHDTTLAPSYFTRMLGTAQITATVPWARDTNPLGYSGSMVALLALSASRKPITNLHMMGVDSELFHFGVSSDDSRELALLRNLLSRVAVLDLSFKFCMAGDMEEDFDRIASILQLARNLRVLHIEFPDRDPRIAHDNPDGHSCLSSLVRDLNYDLCVTPRFPKLEHLSLGSMFCQEEELLALVQGVQKTLKTLSLSTIVLLQPDTSDRESCWVRFFKELRKCKIPDVQVGGLLYNWKADEMPSQRWAVKKSPSEPTSLKSRLQRWVTAKIDGECPLHPLAVRNYEEGYTLRVEDSAQQPRLSDSSWTVINDLTEESTCFVEEGLAPTDPFADARSETGSLQLDRPYDEEYGYDFDFRFPLHPELMDELEELYDSEFEDHRTLYF